VSKAKIGIIGDGNVGSALRRGLERSGYAVRAVGKEPALVRETGQWAEVLVLAIPYGAVDDALRELGEGVNGKTIVDVTNALTPDMQLASGCTVSFPDRLTLESRLLRARSGHAQVEVQ
jgi:predicted dinucleotide-binding enzyme